MTFIEIWSTPPPATPRPCNECPWRRVAVPGYLGPHSAEEWLEMIHGEVPIACHKTVRKVNIEGEGSWEDPDIRQCRGAAMFRANVAKTPRDPSVVTGPSDTDTILANNREFIAHHTKQQRRF